MLKIWCENCWGEGSINSGGKDCPNCQGKGYTELEPVEVIEWRDGVKLAHYQKEIKE